MPSHIPAELRRRLEPIRMLLLDVDGVLTDGSLVYSATGEVVKQFHVRDGLAIRLLLNAGIEVAVVTGRRFEGVLARCRELGIRDDLVRIGSSDKAAQLDELEELLGLSDEQVASLGDDLPELPVLARVGFAACPADAVPEVAAACHMVCGTAGGHGVVRELAELLLKAQGRWQEQVGRWTVRLQPDQDPDRT